jgi:hypothetical protein
MEFVDELPKPSQLAGSRRSFRLSAETAFVSSRKLVDRAAPPFGGGSNSTSSWPCDRAP